MVGSPHLAMFITDLHGNRQVREAAFRRAAEAGAKTLVIGGDLNPKKIYVRLNDGGFLLPDTMLVHSLIHAIKQGHFHSETPRFPLAADSEVDSFVEVPYQNASKEWLQSMLEGLKWLAFWPYCLLPGEKSIADQTLDEIVIPAVRKVMLKEARQAITKLLMPRILFTIWGEN